MNKLINCYYDDETNTLNGTLENGTEVTCLCSDMEDNLDLDMDKRSKFYWLCENCPEECLTLYLSEELQSYLDKCSHEQQTQQQNIAKQLSKTMDEATAEAIAREMIIYGENS